MKRSACLILNAVAVASCLSGPPAIAEGPTPDEANARLTAVLKRESFVFASIPQGLFRAPLATRRWERLKTPPEMPPGGTFAAEPGKSPLVFYVATRGQLDPKPRPGSRCGLYLSRDDGATWELASERDDYGAVLLHPDGALFAVTGRDEGNFGNRILRSPDLGKTWRDITGTAFGQLEKLEPDPDHPGLVRIHAWALRMYTIAADDENYRWTATRGVAPAAGRRPSDDFFSRDSSSTNRYYLYPATLSNYFQYDFGDRNDAGALEVVPDKARYEFARGARVAIPVRVVFHHDPDAMLAYWKKSAAEGRVFPKPAPPTEKFADQADGTDFWGLRVETPEGRQVAHPPAGIQVFSTSITSTPDGKTTTSTRQPTPVAYRIFDLSPSAPYEREVDLGRLGDFSRPGEYRVQLLYNSGGNPDRKKGEWDGGFTSPVFTVVVRE